MPYKQEVIPFWVGPYTITKVHDDNTIQIENMYQKDFGQWKSSNVLLYDCVKPDQVITLDRKETEILTLADYDKVHHKILECYFIQPLPKRISNE